MTCTPIWQARNIYLARPSYCLCLIELLRIVRYLNQSSHREKKGRETATERCDDKPQQYYYLVVIEPQTYSASHKFAQSTVNVIILSTSAHLNRKSDAIVFMLPIVYRSKQDIDPLVALHSGITHIFQWLWIIVSN